MEEQTQQWGWAVHHLATAAAEMDAAIARRLRLSAGDLLALKHLMIAAEPMGPVELGRLLGLTSGAATGLVDRLQRDGWIRRDADPHDRRRQVLTTTRRLHEALTRELRPLTDEIEQAATGLSPAERQLVTRVILDLAGMHRRQART